MAFPTPEALSLASRLPPHPAWLLPAMAGAGLSAGQGHVSLVIWLVAAGPPLATRFPDHFSFPAYAIGVMAFVVAGVAKRLP
jgi:hypothetical protein